MLLFAHLIKDSSYNRPAVILEALLQVRIVRI